MQPGEIKAIHWSPIDKKDFEGYAELIKRSCIGDELIECWAVLFIYAVKPNVSYKYPKIRAILK